MNPSADSNGSRSNQETAIYLAGHGSQTRPRLIELQYRRIVRYREALAGRYEKGQSVPNVFIDFRLPRFAMGQVDLAEGPGFTPDYESAFVRALLEKAGAKVLNTFSDDDDAFKRALKDRCGENARDYEVNDSSDIVCFFPSLASEITATALRRELQDPDARESGQLRRIDQRIEALKRLRPYNGGRHPFIEDRLSSEWQKLPKTAR